jgi:hypothetical protein
MSRKAIPAEGVCDAKKVLDRWYARCKISGKLMRKSFGKTVLSKSTNIKRARASRRSGQDIVPQIAKRSVLKVLEVESVTVNDCATIIFGTLKAARSFKDQRHPSHCST